MLKEVLIELFGRDLGRLKAEIEQYSNEADLWKISGEIPNSAGNLTLHLIGNLQHFFGAVVGGTGYVRDRDAEFSASGVTRAEMLADIDETALVLGSTLEKMTDADFAKDYPVEVFGHPMSTGFFLTHLATHFNYHLGQINYHRRLIASVSEDQNR